MTNIARELTNAPLPQIIERLGAGIAEAQAQLDKTSMALALQLGDREGNGVDIGGERKSLLELGFAPTFYQFTEATIEARVTYSMATSSEFGISVGAAVGGAYGFVMFAASVNVSYSNKYSFESTGASSVTAKLKALPPPGVLTTLLNQINQSDDE